MMAGMWDSRNSRAMIRVRSSALLLDAGLVPYAARRCCMRARGGMVALLSHALFWVMLSMARKMALAVVWPAVVVCGCGGGKMISSMGGW